MHGGEANRYHVPRVPVVGEGDETDPPNRRRSGTGIWWILASARLLRLTLVPLPGYDIGAYRAWSDGMARHGLTSAYELALDPPINYPPVPLYLFFCLGKPHQTVSDDADAPVPGHWIKLAMMAVELAGIVTLAAVIRTVTPDREPQALGVASYAFHPAIVWNTAYWAGIDAMNSLAVLLVLLSAVRDRWMLALAAATAGVLVKPLLAPLWVLVSYAALLKHPRGRIDAVLLLRCHGPARLRTLDTCRQAAAGVSRTVRQCRQHPRLISERAQPVVGGVGRRRPAI